MASLTCYRQFGYRLNIFRERANTQPLGDSVRHGAVLESAVASVSPRLRPAFWQVYPAFKMKIPFARIWTYTALFAVAGPPIGGALDWALGFLPSLLWELRWRGWDFELVGAAFKMLPFFMIFSYMGGFIPALIAGAVCGALLDDERLMRTRALSLLGVFLIGVAATFLFMEQLTLFENSIDPWEPYATCLAGGGSAASLVALRMAHLRRRAQLRSTCLPPTAADGHNG